MKKKIISVILLTTVLFTILSQITVFAVNSGDSVKLYRYGATNAGGHRYNHGTNTSNGISYIDINGKKHSGGWGQIDVIRVGSSDGPVAYCIEMGTSMDSGGNYTAEDISFNDLWRSQLSVTGREYISLVSMYAYPNFTYGAHWVDAYAATQVLIWEFSIGFRVSANGFNNPGGYDGTQLYNKTIKGTPAEAVYNSILSEIKSHISIPSYASRTIATAPTHKMTWNSSTNRCEYTVPTSQIGAYKFTSLPAGVGMTTSGSNTVFYTTAEVTGNSGTVTMKRDLPEPAQDILVFNHATSQKCVAGTAKDPVAAYFKLESEIRGNAKIVKTSEDGVVGNIPFTITGNGVNQNIRTMASGEFLIENLRPGVYTVTEGAIDRYAPQESRQVTVVSGQTSIVTFNNKLKKFNLHIKKTDAKTGYAQGDASLANAKYGVFENGVLVDEYYTDIFGEFDTKTYICGENWVLKELEPSPGYLLDPTEHHIGAEPGNFTIEYNPLGLDVTEDCKMGSVVLVKIAGDGSTAIEPGEIGATFELYLTKAGSYGKARAAEKDILVVDKNGFAESTHQVPFGWYTVHQKDGWEGKEKIEDFQIFVGSEHNESVYRIINNAPITAKIKIEKRDLSTGKLIAASGIGFKLFDPSGKQIIQHYDYPRPADVEIYYTNESGWLMLPEPIGYGKGFKLVEVQTAPPYFLSPDPVFFDVDGSETVVTVTKYNECQMGKIHVDKLGEVFADVIKSGDVYQPVYKVQGMSGAVIDFYCAEDIIINGDVKVKKDTLVSTVTTTKTGGETGLLFPGLYYYIERIAPYSMTGNGEKHYVEIAYAGQTVKESLTTAAPIFNERQKAILTLEKIMEQDKLFKIGINGEILSVRMGLFAAADIVADNGQKIPKDGLIEILAVSEDGSATFKTETPVGSALYVKEISTDKQYQLLGDQSFPVVFEYAGQDTAIVHLKVNDGAPIINDLIRGEVKGLKVDESGAGLGNALIGLFRPDADIFTEESALFITLSADDGSFAFTRVPYNETGWIVREIAPPTAYILSDQAFPVIITEQGAVVEIVMENTLIRGSARTTKVDAEYPTNKLTGAEFDVFADIDGNGVYDEDIDTYAGSMTEIEAGIYQLDDLVYSGYFLHERTSPSGFLKDEGFYFFRITKDGEIVEVENEAGIGFINKPITDIPKTGDISNMGLWIGLGAVALGGLIAALILKKKK